MSSNRGNQGNWRDGARGNRGQFQGSGGRGAGGGRGQFSGEDRDRGGGRGGRGNDGHRGAGGSRGQSYGENRGRGGGRGGYGHFQDDGNHGAGSSRGQSYGEDRSRGGGRGGYGHFQDDGNRGAGGSGSQSYGGGRGRSEGRSDYRGRGEGRSDYRGRGEGRGRGSRGRGGAGGGNFEPAEVVVKLPSYGALKEDLKEYPIDDKELEIPKRIRKPDMKPNPRYFQKEMFTVEVNYVSITFTNPENTRVFHYDVKILPAASKATYRAVMEEMRTRYYVTRYPAFDGERNLYAAGSELSFENNRCSTEGNPITITNDGKTTNFDVEITLVDSDLNMANLDKYIKEGTSLNRPKEMQALEIALKGNLPMRLLQVGKRAFYPKEGNFRALSVGTELRHGLFQGFVMGKEKYLNVDVAHKGFPIAQGVLDYLQAKIGSLPPQLSPNQQDGLGRYLKGLKIHYKNPIDRILSYKNGRLTSKDCDGTTFTKDDGSSISVYQYFVERYNYRIQHRRLPLLDTGNVSKDKHVYLPLELCSIAPNQAVMKAYTPEETEIMVRECSDKPDGRKGKVLDNIRNANYASDDVLSKEFGIAVGTELLQVEAVVLKPPEMKYNNDVKSVVRNGVWRPEKFRTSRQLAKWVILVKEDGYKNNDVTTFFTETFRGKGRELNLTIEPPLETKWSAGSSKEEIKEDFSNLKKTHGELQLIVVVLPSNKSTVSAVYGHVKCVSELNEGILTQCVKWDTLKKMWNRPDNAGMTASNILLKVNAKLGGINYVFRDNIVDNDTMFMGADVTHPGIGSTNPSIATVIGSYNHTAFQYGMVYSVQESRCEPIVKMEDHAKALLKLYQKENKKFPSKIYYYRDGVSEGQFGEMKRTELMAIKEAGKQLNIPNLQVTFLVAQKRHHTRLFPMGNAGDKNGNVVAGTVINRTITHPTEHDFFLVSHQSIQGTARPTKYHAIHNEIGTSEDEIEMLTFHLCHLFARCTRSVKYPAPTYYAHLAGKRTEHYVKGTVNEEAKIINLLANGRVHPDMAARNPMHFI